MRISGFSYIRNGFQFGYPFLQAIQSVLPICDEFIVAVGDSTDGTREAVLALHPSKIRVVDTVWDDELRKSGKIFAQQSDAALAAVSGDWAIHIQADEVIHEQELPLLAEAIHKHHPNPRVEALILPFLHFWGSYNYIHNTRRTHRYEIRAFRTSLGVRPYKDSQGFRKYTMHDGWPDAEKGKKLAVKKVPVRIFHYNYVRNPQEMKEKADYFHRFWHDDNWLEENLSSKNKFDFGEVDMLEYFGESHPELMQEIVAAQNWDFSFDPSRSDFTFKERLLYHFEKLTGYRIGEYRNYRLL